LDYFVEEIGVVVVDCVCLVDLWVVEVGYYYSVEVDADGCFVVVGDFDFYVACWELFFVVFVGFGFDSVFGCFLFLVVAVEFFGEFQD